MITQAAEDAGIRPQTSEFPNGSIQRITRLRNDVAGDDRQMRLQFIEHVDRAAGVAHTEPGAYVKIAQLSDPQSHKIGMKIRDRQIDLLNLKIVPLDDPAISRHRERRRYRQGSRRLDQLAAFRRMQRHASRADETV